MIVYSDLQPEKDVTSGNNDNEDELCDARTGCATTMSPETIARQMPAEDLQKQSFSLPHLTMIHDLYCG